jgi:hypothetical protein
MIWRRISGELQVQINTSDVELLTSKGKPGTELKGRTSSKNTYQEVGSTCLKRRTQYKRCEENSSDFQG